MAQKEEEGEGPFCLQLVTDYVQVFVLISKLGGP